MKIVSKQRMDAFTKRADIDHFAEPADNKTIEENGCNTEISAIVARQSEIRTAIDDIVADLEGS